MLQLLPTNSPFSLLCSLLHRRHLPYLSTLSIFPPLICTTTLQILSLLHNILVNLHLFFSKHQTPFFSTTFRDITHQYYHSPHSTSHGIAMDHQDLTPSLAMNTSTIIKAESTEVEMVNFDATTTSSATCNDADPLFTSLIHWVGPEISSSTFGPLQASEAEVIKNFSDTARAVGVTSKRQQYIDEDQWDEVKMLLWRLWQITEFDRELGQKWVCVLIFPYLIFRR